MTFTHKVKHNGKTVTCKVMVTDNYMTFHLANGTQSVKVWDVWIISKQDLKEILNKYNSLKNS